MPRRARTLLRLQIIDHLTLEEIGAFYQISRATVARHLADARALLVTGTQVAARRYPLDQLRGARRADAAGRVEPVLDVASSAHAYRNPCNHAALRGVRRSAPPLRPGHAPRNALASDPAHHRLRGPRADARRRHVHLQRHPLHPRPVRPRQARRPLLGSRVREARRRPPSRSAAATRTPIRRSASSRTCPTTRRIRCSGSCAPT